MMLKVNADTPPSNLLKLLTEIWQNHEISRQSVLDLIEDFDAEDWLLLVSLHCVCLYGPDRGRIVIQKCKAVILANDGNVNRTIEETKDVNHILNCIHYPDFKKRFHVGGLAQKTDEVSTDPVVILGLLSHLYFHIDSIIILPPDLRQKRLNSIADDYNLSVSCICNMINWLSEIK